MTEVDTLLAGLRGAHLTALLATFGGVTFCLLIAPPAMRPRLLRHAQLSAILSLFLGMCWFTRQAALMADAADISTLLTALPVAGLHTRFGLVLLARLALLLSVPAMTRVPRCGTGLATLAAGLALGSQALIGHAGASEDGGSLAGAELLHLLAAGAWLGGLLPLLVCLIVLPAAAAQAVCQRFSPLGLASVLLIAGTALVQAIPMIGSLSGLVGTPYGIVALIKLALFAGMLSFALWNRVSLTAAVGTDNPDARRRIVLSVTLETLLGLGVTLAAGLLASLPPAAHDIVTWPFSWRPSLAAMEDASVRQDVAVFLVASGLAVALLTTSLLLRRGRIVVAGFAVAVWAWLAPSLSPLLVEAYPTSFRASPTGFGAQSIAAGARLFALHCALCHGATGQGDGPAAAAAHIKPADLTAEHLWEHADGELFWWISQGMAGPDGTQVMPGFAASLSEDDRWALIDLIHARNAGTAMRIGGTWAHVIPAPDMPIACDQESADTLSALRGRFVRVIAADTPAATPPPSGSEALTLILTREAGGAPPVGGCVSATAAAWTAYAEAAGIAPDRLAGTNYLIDSQGALRALRRPTQAADWNDPAMLNATVRQLREQPVTTALGGLHVHGR